MMRSPRTTRSRSEMLEARLREEMKTYRKTLQKISRLKTKVICALREEGCQEAAEMLQTPARREDVARCGNCLGCVTFSTMGPCLLCTDCESGSECIEHTRLCFSWKQPRITFVAGSTVTGVSSLCNLAEYELTKYKELLEKLSDVSVTIEEVIDEFPAGADQRNNDLYSGARRERDLRQEEEHFILIERLLGRHQEHRVRMVEVDSETEEPLDDAEDVGRSHGQPFGFVSATQSHYTFSQFQQRQESLQENIPPGEDADDFQDVEGPRPASIGIGFGFARFQSRSGTLVSTGFRHVAS